MPGSAHCWRLVSIAAVVCIVCVPAVVAQSAGLRWEVLQRYGTEDPPPGSRLGGSSFERIAAIRVFPDGRVAILDQQGKKVALFARDGRFLRTIGLGSGHGPGELANPIALDVSDNRVAVFDYDGNRITVFDTLGKVLWMRTTPRAKQILLVGDTVYGSYMPGRQFMIWRQPTPDLQSVSRLIPVEPTVLRDFDPNGLVAMLTRDPRGDILVADGRPGLWYALSDPSSAKGTNLFPDARAFAFEDMRIPPAQTTGIVALSERYVGIAFDTFGRTGQAPPRIIRQEFAVFDRQSDALVGRLDFSFGEVSLTVLGPGNAPFEVLVARPEPYPHVERIVLSGLR